VGKNKIKISHKAVHFNNTSNFTEVSAGDSWIRGKYYCQLTEGERAGTGSIQINVFPRKEPRYAAIIVTK
jgi:hypothetical protein